MSNNYLVSVFVGGKCANLFFSEDLCELHVCRLLYKGCEIEVFDLRQIAAVPKDKIRSRENEVVDLMKRKAMPEQVVCVETKSIFQSLSVCAERVGTTISDLADSIEHLTALDGKHYLMSGDIY